jgi:GNAT superfamily N-acetyltransferase
MLEYATELKSPTPAGVPQDVPADRSFEHVPSGQLGRNIDCSRPVTVFQDEWAVVAKIDDEVVGRALVSAGQQPYVESLGGQYQFDGAYVRRVYVDREWRNCGIATHLIGECLVVAKTELETRRALALIAPDNTPSRRAFERNGFEPVCRHDYVSLFGREWRRATSL